MVEGGSPVSNKEDIGKVTTRWFESSKCILEKERIKHKTKQVLKLRTDISFVRVGETKKKNKTKNPKQQPHIS